MSAASGTRLTRAQSILLLLLVLSIFINYIDRGNLSIAAPVLEKELVMTPVEVGMLLSAFFWTYALCQLVGAAGWLADHFAVPMVLGAGILIWSGATIATGLASGFTALFATRLVLGIGESLAYPCYSRILATDFVQHQRGFANALLDAGSKLGPALGSLVGGLILAHLGWRLLFIILGGVSLLWLVPWSRWMFESKVGPACRPRCGAGLLRMLQLRSAWGAFLGHFCGNYYWFFLLTWLPFYLVKQRGFSVEQMAVITSVAYFAMATGTVIAGWMSDRQIRLGHTPTRVRKAVIVAGLSFSTIILPVAYLQSQFAAIALLLLACIGFGIYTSNHWAVTQTLAGPSMAGRWTSLQNGIGNLSGVAASLITGYIVQATGSFQIAFWLASLVVIGAALSWGLIVGPVAEVEWQRTVVSPTLEQGVA